MSKKYLFNKKQIVEMAMKFDSEDDMKPHKSIRKNLANNNTPLTKVPFPKVERNSGFRNFQELLASERYKEVLDKVKNYAGLQNVSENDFQMLQMQMMQCYQFIVQTEARHRTQLERLAVELVKGEMGVNDGEIEFDAKIVGLHEINTNFNRRDSQDLPTVDVDGDDDTEDNDGRDSDGDGYDNENNPDVPDVDENDVKVEEQLFSRLKNLDLERAKRRFISAIIQGASKRGHYMYHLVEQRLREITGSDRLVRAYGIMMSVNDLLYWIIPDNYVDAIGMGERGMDVGEFNIQAPNAQDDGDDMDDIDDNEHEVGDQFRGMLGHMLNNPAGSEETEIRGREVPLVKARGFCFPVLLHELVKGVMEILGAHGIPEDPELAQEVIQLEDVLQKEFWDFRLGPAIWARLRQQLPEDILTDENKKELQNYLFVEFFKMPAKEFLIFAREVISGSNTGARLMKGLADEAEKRLNTPDDEEFDYGESTWREDLDSLSNSEDDNKMGDWLNDLGIHLSDDDD